LINLFVWYWPLLLLLLLLFIFHFYQIITYILYTTCIKNRQHLLNNLVNNEPKQDNFGMQNFYEIWCKCMWICPPHLFSALPCKNAIQPAPSPKFWRKLKLHLFRQSYLDGVLYANFVYYLLYVARPIFIRVVFCFFCGVTLGAAGCHSHIKRLCCVMLVIAILGFEVYIS